MILSQYFQDRAFLKRFSTYSLFFACIAIISFELSCVLGGVTFLDALTYLLIPAFLLYLALLFFQWPNESNDYRIGLIFILGSMAVAISFKLNYVIGTINDQYHIALMASHVVRNSIETRWLCLPDGLFDWRFYLLTHIEGIWGILWRWTQWDFVVPLTQNLPLLVVWHELVRFFRSQGIQRTAGYLALVVIFSAETFWSQQGSGYIDGLVGMFGLLTLLLSYRLLANRQQKPSFEYILGFALVIILYLNSKINALPFSILGICIVWRNAWQYLDNKKRWVVLAVLFMGVTYFLNHQAQVWKQGGTPVAIISPNSVSEPKNFSKESPVLTDYAGGSYDSKGFEVLRRHGITLKPAYLLVSRLADYKYKEHVTPDPTIRGRGVLWTYFVFPMLLFLLIKGVMQPKKSLDHLKKPQAIIFWIILILYVTVSGCITTRHMVAIESFIMAWCLMVVWKKMQAHSSRIWLVSRYVLCFIFVASAFGNYVNSIDGNMFLKKRGASYIKDQVSQFPYFIHINSTTFY